MEIESKHTPEEMDKIQKKRSLSDAELIKGGAEYRPTPGVDGKVDLELTYEQKETIRLEKELEKEGSVYDDLATYIRLNKRVVCPKEELSEELKEEILKNKGVVWKQGDIVYRFIDKDGNITGFKEPQIGEIKSLEGAFSKDHSYYSINKLSEMVRQELKKDGFDTLPLERTSEQFASLIGRIEDEVFNYKQRIKGEQKHKRSRESDF